MSLIDFIKAVEESQEEFDVELEEFDADSEQAATADDSSGGRSLGRLFLVVVLLAGAAYVVYRLRSSAGNESFTDIELGAESADAGVNEAADDATVSVEHDPDDETTGDEAAPEETESESDTEDDAVEVEIESPDDDSDDDA
ncbi:MULTISPECIES: hypothetical protein [Haloferax]|uniref:Uncharacterized protein n=1 Tax=Haloferax marinum TaxID=2666143 RepID=A0A6A8G8V6_9EURY|nr:MULTISPECIES: hypothetical protein [Haloferax]KAB1197972.1 hypothetical protein Hfx1150_10750 [Haloferax sp. CBA1150]MRW97038.1 hypothetical protein [Haloferax marinum]